MHDGTAARIVRDWILSEPMSWTTEGDLQGAIWERLLTLTPGPHGIAIAAREWILDAHNRVDFLVDVQASVFTTTAVGVEVKIGGSFAAVRRQLDRYATFTDIDELLLVTSKASHHKMPTRLNGKPVVLCSLVEAGL